jgi:hypothetical protein
VWVGVDMWVEVVGRWDEEIVRGGRFRRAKPKTEPCELNFSPGCVKQDAGDRWNAGDGEWVVVMVVACCTREIAWGADFGRQKGKLVHVGSVFFRYTQIKVQTLEAVHGEIGVVVEAVVYSVGLIEWGVAKLQTEPARVRFLSGV